MSATTVRFYPVLFCCSDYYVYDNDLVARRYARFPELPRRPANEQCGLLSKAAAADEDGSSATAIKQFQVVSSTKHKHSLFSGVPAGGSFDIEVFSSSSGEWTPLRLPYPAILRRYHHFTPPSLGQDGTAAYFLGLYPWPDLAVAYSYSSVVYHHSVHCIEVPYPRDDDSGLNRCVREHRGGGLRYAHFDGMHFVVWDSDDHRNNIPSTTWTQVHSAAVRDVLHRSSEAAFFRSGSKLGWSAVRPKTTWCSVFTLLGFGPGRRGRRLLPGTAAGTPGRILHE
ncbi:hypothetical protein PR202_ga10709 [Eleusine coracana subsp. coracana]|uniref:F-box protein n=1 Tax=Eleusine coracana subsp. coracana TaxID=191504 RepID=A0AAV5C7K2_ELECO|nr:hypothetical protein PR202_ga10709 [Eleusine coracana subsp. coracana]